MPEPVRAQPPDYYYRAYTQMHHPAHWFHKRRLGFLASLVPNDSVVLDAGCGSGVLAWLLTQKGCLVTGVDYDAARLEFAQQICLESAFVLGDLRQLNLSRQFDVVICADVLEHFSEQERPVVVTNLVRHLKHDGLLILSFPSLAYCALEPLWWLARRFLFRYRWWDDQPKHHRVEPSIITDCTAVRDGAICLGLVHYSVIRRLKS